MSTADAGSIDLSSLSDLGDTGNSYNFSTGLGNIDPNSGLNSLNAGLTGAGAGTLPNGYINGASNYTPDVSGISAGSLNGNTSFGMPGDSLGQLNSQSLAQALAAGSKLTNMGQTGTVKPQGGSGRVSMHQVTFANPLTNFSGSNGGSQIGNSLLELLAKRNPGAQ